MANAIGTLAHCAYYEKKWVAADALFAEARQHMPGERGAILTDEAYWARAIFEISRDPALCKTEGFRLKRRHEAMSHIEEAARAIPLHGDLTEAFELLYLRAEIFWEAGNVGAALRDLEDLASVADHRPLFSRLLERVATRGRYHRLAPRLIDGYLHLAEQRSDDRAESVRSAFEHVERKKATGLRELLLVRDAMPLLPDDLRDALNNAIGIQQQAFLGSLHGGSDADAAPALDSIGRLGDSEARLEALYRDISQRVPNAASLVAEAPTPADVQQALPVDGRTAVLQLGFCERGLAVFLVMRQHDPSSTWGVVEGWSETRLRQQFTSTAAFLDAYNEYAKSSQTVADKRRDLWTTSDAAERESINRSLAEEKFALAERHYHWAVQLRSLIADTTKIVDGLVVQGGHRVRDLLQQSGITQLTIVPDGFLGRLPLHTAFPGVSVSFCPSCGVMLSTAAKPPDPLFGRMLIVDNPDGSLPLAALGAARLEQKARRAGLTRPRRFGAAGSSTRETAGDWILGEMNRASWLHLGTHAKSDLVSPWRSYLHVDVPDPCAPGSPSGWDRQFLSADRIAARVQVPTGAGAFWLGCSTGVASEEFPGEFAGLPAAALACGYSVVVATLWDVPEGSAVTVADLFYDYVLDVRVDMSTALATACRDVKAMRSTREIEAHLQVQRGAVTSEEDAPESKPSHPLHWAAFVMWGTPWRAARPSQPSSPLTSKRPSLVRARLSADMADRLKQAAEAFRLGDFRKTVSLLEPFAEAKTVMSVHAILGDAYSALDDTENAKLHETVLVKLDPNSFRAHYNLGCSYRELGLVREARACFEASLSLNPGYAKAYCNIADLLNDPTEALVLLRKAADIDADDPDYRRGIAFWQDIQSAGHIDWGAQRLHGAEEAVRHGKYKQARTHLGLARDTALPPVLEGIAANIESNIRRGEGDLPGSVALLEQAVSKDPSQAMYWNNIGARKLLLADDPGLSPMERQKLLHEILHATERASGIADYARPHQNRAGAYFNLRDLENAQIEATKALRMVEDQIEAHARGDLVCVGCPTEGNIRSECSECLSKAHGTLRNIELASGNYRV
jgi:CHAT domain-containing protein/tetratricopeptide (TPR) repeat protein